jgi:hypothetical protein
MTTALIKPVIAGDPRPVEKAVIHDIIDDLGPLKWLTISFEPAAGGLRYYQAWTAGGDLLGDQVDDLALARGLDGADWLDITGRHEQITYRGKVKIQAYDLPSIRVDVDLGHGQTDDTMRDKLRRLINDMAEHYPNKYRPVRLGEPLAWSGVGPRMHNRRRS